ncbi:MAG: bifunctional DNA primase/polymerase [Nitrososphaerota archaeon]
MDYINYYLSQGFSIIPCLPNSKIPAVKWKEFQLRKPSNEEIENWRKLWENGYNVAVIAGSISGNLVVIDVDSYKDSCFLRAIDFDRLLESTFVVETPSGGLHIYFRFMRSQPSFNLMHDGKVIAEIRGEGRYVLAPPSIAISKVDGTPKQYVCISKTTNIPIVSGNIVDFLKKRFENRLGINVSIIFEGTKISSDDSLGRLFISGKPYRGRHPPCFEKLLCGVREGFRNEGAVRVASYFLTLRKLKPDSVWKKLLEWNLLNEPPLDIKELERCFKSVLGKGYRYGCNSMKIFYCDRTRCPLKPFKPITDEVSGLDWEYKLKKKKIIQTENSKH